MSKSFNEKFPQIKIDYSKYKSVDEWRKNPTFVWHNNLFTEDKKATTITWKEVIARVANKPFTRQKEKWEYPCITLLPYIDGYYYHAVIDIDNHDDVYNEKEWSSREEFENAIPKGMKPTLHNDRMCLYWEHSYSVGHNAWCLLLTQPYKKGIPTIGLSEHLKKKVKADKKAFYSFHKRSIYNNNGHVNYNVSFDDNREFYTVRIEGTMRGNFEKRNSYLRDKNFRVIDSKTVQHIFIPNLYHSLQSASKVEDGLFDYSCEHRIFDTMSIYNITKEDVENNFTRVGGKSWYNLRQKPPYPFKYPNVEKVDNAYIGQRFGYKFFAENDGFKDHVCYIVTTGRGKSHMLVDLTKYSKNNIILTFLKAVVFSYEGKNIKKRYSDGRETINLSDIKSLEEIKEGNNYYGTVQKMIELFKGCKNKKTINNVCRIFSFPL